MRICENWRKNIRRTVHIKLNINSSVQLVQVLKKIFLKIFQIAEKRKENYKKEDWQRTPTLPAICFLLYLFTPSPVGEMYENLFS